jgi:hypothetical protein
MKVFSGFIALRYRTLYTALLLGLAILLDAQVRKEELVVLSDRGHYISGETIRYRAFYRPPDAELAGEWSRVLYVELIQPNGTTLVQGKVRIDTLGAAGSLVIPEGLSSGTYYLKAYTRWMRNCGPEGYAYTSLRIYDPFSEEVLPVDSTGWESKAAWQMMNRGEEDATDVLQCSLAKERYGIREEVSLNLKWNMDRAPADLTVSVSRMGLHGNQSYYRKGCETASGHKAEILPEMQGLSLTGQVVSSDGSPAPYATVYVSVLGEEKDFFCNYSDSVGRFYFSLPDYKGKRELFVSAYHSDYPGLELLIDRDFSQDRLNLPSYPVQLNDSLTAIITEMSVNAQVAEQYYPSREPVQEPRASEELLFYGHPVFTIKFDDFIKLPNLAEYFLEVVPQVAVKRSRGVRRLVVLGEHPDLAVYSPLLMIDGVAIFDVEAVLAVSPRLIDRLEIINAPYIRGNVTFGGIISLISKNNDLGYIDLPSSGLLVDYQMLDLPRDDPEMQGIGDPRMPDVRNTLYWNPELILSPGTDQHISFRTSDLKGEYEILIRGTGSDGRYFEKRLPFLVE